MNDVGIEFGGGEAAPVDMLAALFEARGWSSEVVSEEEIVAEIPGSWATYEIRAVWRREDNVLQLIAFPDIRANDEKVTAISQVLALINEQLWLGHFDIWSNTNVVLYRHGMLLGSDGLLGLDQAQLLIETAVDECDRFYPVFQFILWGDKSPQDALVSALIDTQGEA